MVLVDTSVWIRFLAGREPHASGLDHLLAHDEVVGHELIFGELLIGDLGGRAKLLTAYSIIQQASVVSHGDVVEFVRGRKLHGRGIGWIDAHLLASCVIERIVLWTAEPRFAALAAELGVCFAELS